MRKRKLRKKRVLILLVGILALSGMIFSITYKDSTEAVPLKMDPTYPNVELSSISENGMQIDFPVFHIDEIDQLITAYIQERMSSFEEATVMTYDIVHYSEQTVAIQFTDQQTTETLNIDLTDGTLLSLEDLVVEQKMDDFVKKLSNIAYAESKKSNQSFSSEQETFQDFILYNQSIVFNLKDMQLAVSKQLFDDLLKDRYKAGKANEDIVGDNEPGQVITEQPTKGIEDLVDKKVIALTFDDGPKQGTTDIILDALKKHDAHATFFVLGSMAEKSPELLRRMVEEGQEIGSHTYDHPQLTKVSEQEIFAQLNRTQEVIQQSTGKGPTAFRPPYGSIDDRVRACLGDNMEVVLWDIDTEDWKYRDTNHIAQAVMNNAADGRIILMHDIYKTSAEAAVTIIEQLSAQGYEIVTASDLREIQKRRMLASEE